MMSVRLAAAAGPPTSTTERRTRALKESAARTDSDDPEVRAERWIWRVGVRGVPTGYSLTMICPSTPHSASREEDEEKTEGHRVQVLQPLL